MKQLVKESLNNPEATLKPYERANRWMITSIKKDKEGRVSGLYFWGSNDEQWRKSAHGEYKIDNFRCTDPWVALRLAAEGYAIIKSFVDEPGGDKVIMLLMKREY